MEFKDFSRTFEDFANPVIGFSNKTPVGLFIDPTCVVRGQLDPFF